MVAAAATAATTGATSYRHLDQRRSTLSLKPTVGRWGTVRRTALAAVSSAVLAVAGLAVSPTPAAAQSNCQWGTGRNGSAHQQSTSGDCAVLGARHFWYINAIGESGWTPWSIGYNFPGTVRDGVAATYSHGQGQGYTP